MCEGPLALNAHPNLRNIFVKLDIGSRAEWARTLVADDRLTVSQPGPALVGIDGMRRGEQLDVCGNLAYLPDSMGAPSSWRVGR